MAHMALVARSIASGAVLLRLDSQVDVGLYYEPDVSPLWREGRVQLEFNVLFPGGAVIRAWAEVTGVQHIRVLQPNERRLEATIEHDREVSPRMVYASARGYPEDCLLHCPATGKRSTGPCIECSDGEFTIQLCC